jgi:hypothetical protein
VRYVGGPSDNYLGRPEETVCIQVSLPSFHVERWVGFLNLGKKKGEKGSIIGEYGSIEGAVSVRRR